MPFICWEPDLRTVLKTTIIWKIYADHMMNIAMSRISLHAMLKRLIITKCIIFSTQPKTYSGESLPRRDVVYKFPWQLIDWKLETERALTSSCLLLMRVKNTFSQRKQMQICRLERFAAQIWASLSQNFWEIGNPSLRKLVQQWLDVLIFFVQRWVLLRFVTLYMRWRICTISENLDGS